MLSGREVRVGIYENPPKVFLDETENPQGIFDGIGIGDMDAYRRKGTLGYHLTHLLTEQLHGTISISGDKGVYVKIEFSLLKILRQLKSLLTILDIFR